MTRIIDAHVHIIPEHLALNRDGNSVRFEKYGRAQLPDGNVYQFMPDYCAESVFDAETLIRVMDNLFVEKSVIMQGPLYGFLNDDLVSAVQKYPTRLAAAMQIDPMDENCITDMERYAKKGLSVMKFELSEGVGFCGRYPDLRLDAQNFMTIWAKAEELGLTVTIDPSRIGTRGYQVEALEKVVPAFERVNFVICHLGFPYKEIRRNALDYDRWKRMTALADRENVWFDISALAAFYQSEGYPFPSAAEITFEFVSKHGARKIIWGSDIPGTLCFATYRQLLDMFAKSDLFSEAEKEMIFFRNASLAYKLGN